MLFWAFVFFVGAIVSGILAYGGYLGYTGNLVAFWAFGGCIVVFIFFIVAYFRSRKGPPR